MRRYNASDYSSYSQKRYACNWSTVLHIHGDNLERDSISKRLGLNHEDHHALAMCLTDHEQVLAGLSGVLGRAYQACTADPRMVCGNFWVHGLTNKQLTSTYNVLERHLETWLDLLYIKRSALAEFKQLGYWTALDCVAVHDSAASNSVQFRLPPDLLAQLGRLGIDLDFTVVDIRTIYRQEIADGSVSL